MGADIHAFIEWFDDRHDRYFCFAEKINVRRDYLLFAVLAGVRNADYSVVPVSAPKGLPDDISEDVVDHYYLKVSDEASICHDLYYCSSTDADRYIAGGSTEFRVDNQWFVSNPDWHTPSWLTLKSLQYAQHLYRQRESWSAGNISLAAIIGAMESLDRLTIRPSRLVFWFDN